MKLFAVIALCLWMQTEALRCWTCEDVESNVECNRRGNLRQCQKNENACQNTIRRGPYGILITKRCKQDLACSNNQVQNSRLAWSPTQCNPRAPSSVCRCCCSTDGCNSDQFCRQKDAVDCPPLSAPEFGRIKLCKFSNRLNEIGSICEFECNSGYRMVGSRYSQCKRVSEFSARFDNTAVRCVKEQPCTVQNSIIDLVIVVDSSGSIGKDNWPNVTAFVESFIKEFTIGEDASRIGVFRYHSEVVDKLEILLRDFSNHKQLLERFVEDVYRVEEIYRGGTFTGKALDHARTVSFSRQSGNRPSVPDYLLVITDGESDDDLTHNAQLLRDDNVHILAVGIEPERGSLNEEQLRNLVKHEEDRVIADTGFSGLKEKLLNKLVQIVGRPGC